MQSLRVHSVQGACFSLVAFALSACTAADDGGVGNSGGDAGRRSGGGNGAIDGSAGNAGIAGNGGATGSSGTTSGASGNGGAGNGGSPVGGAAGAGGNGGTSGGNAGTAGIGGSAGATGTAGTAGSGGRGGTAGSAGTAGTAGSAGRGGTAGTGGTAGRGGTGGTAGTGGAAGTGGNTCTEANKQVCNNEIGTHCGYTYEYWKDQGSGCLVNTNDGFSVDWSNINNLLGRKGLRPGSMNQIVTYDANYQPNGNSYLCVYGWTKSPLVEYYIVDSWGSWRPPGATSMGTINSDGGTYDIYRTERVNQPSIEGTRTFSQYWSVRTQKRASGTITVANHFGAWASRGMNMGSLYEVSMTVEGYQSSGTADVNFSMR
jgi:endo-1,4-beta-xylanase